ncbi:MAG: hypothetical protein LC754_19120 [Acidobacteria bacterium]|nr:hypothetical protein [Acidobacteriota bacterium]
MKDILATRRASGNISTPPQPPRWELSVFAHLIVAIQAQASRIVRLEEFNAQLARDNDRMRSCTERRAA